VSGCAKIYRRAVRCVDPTGREIVADKQFIDDKLNLFGVQIHVAAHQRSKPR